MRAILEAARDRHPNAERSNAVAVVDVPPRMVPIGAVCVRFQLFHSHDGQKVKALHNPRRASDPVLQ
jgi:hypothetical protein